MQTYHANVPAADIAEAVPVHIACATIFARWAVRTTTILVCLIPAQYAVVASAALHTQGSWVNYACPATKTKNAIVYKASALYLPHMFCEHSNCFGNLMCCCIASGWHIPGTGFHRNLCQSLPHFAFHHYTWGPVMQEKLCWQLQGFMPRCNLPDDVKIHLAPTTHVLLPEQAPLLQSDAVLQPFPTAHFFATQSGPPQSTSVSVPLSLPSAHVLSHAGRGPIGLLKTAS